MKTESVICDHCLQDLNADTRGSDTRGYALRLGSMIVRPPGTIGRTLGNDPMPAERHFCNLACLWAWLDEGRPKQRPVLG